MPTEIERKFLVKNLNFKDNAFKKTVMKQGYLSSVIERTVRVRSAGDQAFITVKGKGSASGMSRYEWEKEIGINDAEDLLKICEPGVIDKCRYFVKLGEHTYEIDEFFGDNEGLIVAEIELSSEDEVFMKPDWLGTEVTGSAKYYNGSLSKNPFKNW